jgi:hypothetical protein
MLSTVTARHYPMGYRSHMSDPVLYGLDEVAGLIRWRQSRSTMHMPDASCDWVADLGRVDPQEG